MADERRSPAPRHHLQPDAGLLAVTRALIRDTGARTILGVNLEARQPALAATEARALIAGIGRSSITGMEIGDEPTNYPWFPRYRVGHRLVYARPHSYRFPDFVHEVSAIRQRRRGRTSRLPTHPARGFDSTSATPCRAAARSG